MEKIGRALHFSGATGNVIVKASFAPKVGSKVCDKKLRSVGTVFDVFGPIASPYVSIKTSRDRKNIIDQILFLRNIKRNVKRGK